MSDCSHDATRARVAAPPMLPPHRAATPSEHLHVDAPRLHVHAAQPHPQLRPGLALLRAACLSCGVRREVRQHPPRLEAQLQRAAAAAGLGRSGRLDDCALQHGEACACGTRLPRADRLERTQHLRLLCALQRGVEVGLLLLDPPLDCGHLARRHARLAAQRGAQLPLRHQVGVAAEWPRADPLVLGLRQPQHVEPAGGASRRVRVHAEQLINHRAGGRAEDELRLHRAIPHTPPANGRLGAVEASAAAVRALQRERGERAQLLVDDRVDRAVDDQLVDLREGERAHRRDD
mmetsp:Transcript_42077/g.74020  ORF Transcript_42077/g.74020 Transcript_42077/m.74020 type:complete len:291 (+) Transcript_42077:334-1206(+)